jgi:soluble lytic murein transglycosylase
MSTRSAPSAGRARTASAARPSAGSGGSGPPRRTPGPARRRRTLRRRLAAVLGVAALMATALVLTPIIQQAVQEVSLPLRHEDIIRQQARDKDLDPSLIAGVIYTESRFRDRTSSAGAKGLMQIMPDTARYIARRSGGTQFELADLATPQVNLAYGSFYLRYLLDKYGENELLALAAYNGGEANVDRWVVTARRQGEQFKAADHIPFPETRDYVEKVLSVREQYRDRYAAELGL